LPTVPNHRHQQLQLSVDSPFVDPHAKDDSSVTHNRCASDIGSVAQRIRIESVRDAQATFERVT
jgi:hypothetical protein